MKAVVPFMFFIALIMAFTVLGTTCVSQTGSSVIIPPSSVARAEDYGLRVHTNIAVVKPDHLEIGANGAPLAENPASLACIYHLVKATKGCPQTSTIIPTGGAKAIAVVDADDNPHAASDLRTFAAAYGYPTPKFKKVKVGHPKPDAFWSLEISLDIEYVFSMAPNAQIYLVEANSNSWPDILAAEDKATQLIQKAGGGQVSNSWGATDFSGEIDYDSHFKGKGIVYFASSGDVGAEVLYPSSSPFVVSVGGTQINRNSDGSFQAEAAWSDAGGGPSQYEPRPTYQDGIKNIVGDFRGTPDISSNAAYPGSPVAIYSHDGQYCHGWCVVGGTSVSCPTIAGIVNAAGGFKNSSTKELSELYKDYGDPSKYKTDFRDIKTGSNGHDCKKGWEFCTGIGAPLTYKDK